MVSVLNIAVNSYAFHWAYPEIAADELGLFRKEGIKIEWHDVTPKSVVSKTDLYKGLLAGGDTDVYHAGEWACINRVLGSPDSEILAKSMPGRGTLNSSFSLYAGPDSDVRRPGDLAGRTVAIEKGTGSFYTTVLDLEKYLQRDQIKLVEMGEPHKRLIALLEGEVQAASLVGPWVDAADYVGLRQVLKTRRKNPTTIVVRRETEVDVLRGFFRALNSAISLIDKDPARFRKSYFSRVEPIVETMPSEVRRQLRGLGRRIQVSKWRRWEPYTPSDFVSTYNWLVERHLVDPGRRGDDVLAPNASAVFR